MGSISASVQGAVRNSAPEFRQAAVREIVGVWPPGVFAEDTDQAKELLRVRRERGLGHGS
jgi:hypothetical protein